MTIQCASVVSKQKIKSLRGLYFFNKGTAVFDLNLKITVIKCAVKRYVYL